MFKMMSDVKKAAWDYFVRHAGVHEHGEEIAVLAFLAGAAWQREQDAAFVNAESLFLRIAHGDRTHQEWLKVELTKWFADKRAYAKQDKQVSDAEQSGVPGGGLTDQYATSESGRLFGGGYNNAHPLTIKDQTTSESTREGYHPVGKEFINQEREVGCDTHKDFKPHCEECIGPAHKHEDSARGHR